MVQLFPMASSRNPLSEEKKKFFRIDLPLVVALTIILLFSVMTLLSIGAVEQFRSQLLFFVVGGILMIGISLFDTSFLLEKTGLTILFATTFVLLLLVIVLNWSHPLRSWFRFGTFSFQPVELAKPVFLMALASFFAHHGRRPLPWIDVVRSLALTLPFFLVVIVQPDFGSALFFPLVWLCVMLPHLSKKDFFILCGVLVVLSLLSWNFALRPYQKERILTFANPERDPLGYAYNLWQTKIAAGSGGIVGKGFGGGSQARLGFLPAATTDFLLASFLEEWGIVGWTILLGCFAVVLVRLSYLSSIVDHAVAQFFVRFYMLALALQFFIASAVNLGMAPIVGLPFPFFSYGGSHLVVNLAVLGFIQSLPWVVGWRVQPKSL